MSLDWNWRHLQVRGELRLSDFEVVRVINTLKHIAKLCKARQMPNKDWHKSVTDNKNNTVAYIVGKGVNVRSLFSRDMTPHGVAI